MSLVGCKSFAVDQWLARRPEAVSVLRGRPVVEICPSGEGRGLGLFASSPIQAFSQIVVDAPLILMRPEEDLPELYQHFRDLPDHQRHNFLALGYSFDDQRDALLRSKIVRRGLDSQYGKHALAEMIKVANIMQTNAFNVDVNDGRGSCHRAVFANIARINHSCAPNAHVCFYPPSSEAGSRGRMAVHALRSLDVGEEVLISYFNILLPRFSRQEKAMKWGFHCQCPVCAHELPEMTGEELRVKLQSFQSSHGEILQSTRVTLREINSLAEFGNMLADKALLQPALFPTLPDLYDALGMLQAKAAVIKMNDEQRGGIVSMMEQSTLWEARITGPDSRATDRRLQKLTQFAVKKGSSQKATVSIDDRNGYNIVWLDTH